MYSRMYFLRWKAARPQGSIYHGYTGKGVIVAVLDSELIMLIRFLQCRRNNQNSELWDQTLGKVYTSEEINEALTAPDERARYEMIPSRDLSGHGTHVAEIAAAMEELLTVSIRE